MLGIICNIICIFLLIVGTVELIRILILFFLNANSDQNDSAIVIPINDQEEAEYLIRNEITRAKWFEFNRAQNIICLDCGMDEETRKVCEAICEDYDFIKICKPYELYDILNSKTN